MPIFPFSVRLVAIFRHSRQYDAFRNHRNVRYFRMEEEGGDEESDIRGTGKIGYEGAVGAKTAEKATRT